jgi:hypothetical protein
VKKELDINYRIIIILLGCAVSLALFLPGTLANITHLLGFSKAHDLMLYYSQVVFMHYVFDFGWLLNLLAIIACIKWKQKRYIKVLVLILNIIPFTAILVALPLLLP